MGGTAFPWLESAKCRIMLDMMLTERHAATFAELDEAEIAATIMGAGAEVVTIWFKDENGYASYPTKIGTMHPRLAGRDFAGRLLTALKALGARVVAYYCVGLDRHYAIQHPEDQVVFSDGRPGFVPIPCISCGYREHALRQIEEIVRNYQVDGLWLDCIWFPQRDFFPNPESRQVAKSEAISCFCASCEDGYRRRYGEAMPRESTAGESQWGRWLEFKHAALDSFLRQARARARTLNAEVAVAHNLTSFNQHDGRGGLPFEVAILSHGELWDWTPKSIDQLTAEAMIVAANGGAVLVDDHLTPAGKTQSVLYDRIGAVFARLKQVQEYLEPSDTLKHVAVVYSERSRDLIGKGDATRYQSSFDGACRALIEEKVPFDVLPDELLTVERISGYRAIVLPNVACLSDESCAPHLFVDFESCEDELTRGIIARLPVNMKKPGCHVEGLGRGIGSLRVPMVWACNHFYRYYENPPGEREGGAALWVALAGKGRAVYFPCDVMASYGEFTIPEARGLLANALRHAGGEPEISVTGPDSVEAVYLEQPERGRIAVHLITFPSVPGRTALVGGRLESVQVVGRIPRAHDLQLRLSGSLLTRARSVRSVTTGDLPWHPGQDRVSLPPVEVHDVIIVATS